MTRKLVRNTIGTQRKKIELMTMCRLPSTSSNGTYCSLTHHNRIDGKMSTTSVCRIEIFNEIINHMKNNPEINDVVLGGDYNQYLNNDEVRRFHDAIGIHEMHLIINNVPMHQIVKHASMNLNQFIR